jgi:hypothetical protein
MNTNTFNQSEKLKKLCIIEDYANLALLELFKFKFGVEFSGAGPLLVLDDLHKIFEHIGLWPNLDDGVWSVLIDSEDKTFEFFSTGNHAEDWTNILIWLLEEKHIDADPVNEALNA